MPVVIKRHRNRKYWASDEKGRKGVVTIKGIMHLVQMGKDVSVYDYITNRDITERTLAKALCMVPLTKDRLVSLIRKGGL